MPPTIIQHAVPGRTGSTFQFTMLVAAALLRWKADGKLGEPPNVHKVHEDAHVLEIIKSDATDENGRPPKAWVFATAEDALPHGDVTHAIAHRISERFRKLGLNQTVDYVMTSGLLERRGYHVIGDLQPIFGLSNHKTNELLDYARYFTILRQCCGRHMSEPVLMDIEKSACRREHRTRSGDAAGRRVLMNSTRNRHSTAYAACEMYDTDQVESLMMQTYIFREFGAPSQDYGQALGAFFCGAQGDEFVRYNGSACSACRVELVRATRAERCPEY